MKKVKLIKSLLISAPIVVTPLLANSCNSSDTKQLTKLGPSFTDRSTLMPSFVDRSTLMPSFTDSSTLSPAKIGRPLAPSTTVTAKYYVDALATALKAELDTIASQVASTARTGSNTLDITSQINTAIANAKQAAPNISSNIDNITLAFSGTGNLKVEKNNDTYTLTVYPSFVNSSSADQTLTTTLSLTLSASNKNTQAITNTYNVPKGFKRYTSGLPSSGVNAVYVSDDGNTVFAGTSRGLAIGKRNGLTYTFKNISSGLVNTDVRSVYSPNNGATIYVATNGGLSVGTRGSNDTYTYINSTTTQRLGSNNLRSVYATTGNDPTVVVGTIRGLSVGFKKGDQYYFENLTTTSGLGSNQINSVYASPDGSIIYAGTGSGVSVGIKQSDFVYTFTNSTSGLGNRNVTSVYPSSNGNTIYAGTYGGVSVGTKQSSSNKYTFTNYNTSQGLGANIVSSVYPSSDGNTIYAGTVGLTRGGGVSVGTKQSGSNKYTFTNYTSGLTDRQLTSVYLSSDNNAVCAGTYGGLVISKNNWVAAQSNFSYSTNNYQAITLTNKNDN